MSEVINALEQSQGGKGAEISTTSDGGGGGWRGYDSEGVIRKKTSLVS